jgi:hypothetical protein
MVGAIRASLHIGSTPLKLIVLPLLVLSMGISRAQSTDTAATAVPVNEANDAKQILLQISHGNYRAPYISVFESPIQGSTEDPLPLADETSALIRPGGPCKEPATPDPNWKPANTGEYWMHKFGDKQIEYPPAERASYEDLMSSYRKMCHTRWILKPLLQGSQKPVLVSEIKAAMNAEEAARCAAAGPQCTQREPRLVFAEVSPIVFTHEHTLALALVEIHAGGMNDQSMWIVFGRHDGKWAQRTDWGGALTVHD